MALATLSIDLEAKLAKLQEGMDKAGRLAEIQAARIDKAFAGIRNTAASLGSAIAGAFVVDGISAFVRRTIDGIDALNDLADASGASVENISALEDIAARTGTSFDTVGAALVKFNAGLKETNPNSPAALALKQIGLNAEELRRIDPAEALKRTADALAGYADDGDKARLVQELFGKSVKEVGPYLKDLAEAGGLNATVTAKQAKEAEAFNKQIFELQKNLTDLSRVMVGPVVSGFNDLIERFRMASREGRSFYSVITEQYRRSNGTMPIVGATAEDAARLTDSQRRAIEDRGFNPFAKSVGPMPASGGGTKAKAAAFADYAQEVQQAVAGMVRDTDIVRIAELNAQLEELNRLAAAGLDPAIVSDVQRQLQDRMAKLRPATTAQEDFRRSELGGGASPQDLKDYADQQERLNQLLAATPLEKQERLQKDIALLVSEFEAGRLGAEKYTEAVQSLVGTLPDDLAKTNDIAKELGMTFASAAEDAIVKWRGFGALLDGLAQDIQRILARKLITEPLAQSLTDWLKPSGGSSGGFDLLGMAGSAWSKFAGLFAEGGYVPPGQWGIAGERGPEPIFGGRTGLTVQPAGGGGGGAAARPLVQHFHFSSPIDRRTQAQIGADAFRGAQRAAARNN